MKLENEYLSDEELEQLIGEVEQNELVTAPPELLGRIMAELETVQAKDCEDKQQSNASGNRIKEFRGYCFRVLTSVAAAIAMVFLLPELWKTQLPEVPVRKDTVEAGKYATKEEALADTGFLAQILGGTNIFDSDNEFHIFNGKNGG